MRSRLKAICIDPGSEKSAVVFVEVGQLGISPPWGVKPLGCQESGNPSLRLLLHAEGCNYDFLVIELMAGVFQGSTARDQLLADGWGHRFIEAFTRSHELAGTESRGPLVIRVSGATRRAAVLGTARGNDTLNRRALIDMYGGDKQAFGKKCQLCKGRGWRGRGRDTCEGCSGEGWDPPPGPLHGWAGTHVYAALGCAIAAFQPGGGGRPRSAAERLLGSGELHSSLRPPSGKAGRRVPPKPSLEELEKRIR